jgi:hypothetical protein
MENMVVKVTAEVVASHKEPQKACSQDKWRDTLYLFKSFSISWDQHQGLRSTDWAHCVTKWLKPEYPIIRPARNA